MAIFSSIYSVVFAFFFLAHSTFPFVVADTESVCAEGDNTCLNPAEGTKKYDSDKDKQNEVDISKTGYDSCVDSDPNCVSWAASGECTQNAAFMLENCQFSCDACSQSEKDLGVNFGVAQTCDGASAAEVKQFVEETEKYWEDVDDMIKPHCVNKDSMCSYWASIGECEDNTNWMSGNCGPACRKCG